MTDQHPGPDTDDRAEPGGTPPPGSGGDLIAKPTSPGAPDTHLPTAVPGAYDADEAQQDPDTDGQPGS